jgi:cell division protein FtsX
LLEGFLHGILGGLCAGIVLWLMDRSIQSLIAEVIPMLSRYFTSVNMREVALLALASGSLIGAGGSLLSIRRYLRVV